MDKRVKRTLDTIASDFEAFMKEKGLDPGERYVGKGADSKGKPIETLYSYWCPYNVRIAESDMPKRPGFLLIVDKFQGIQDVQERYSPEQLKKRLNAIKQFANSRGKINRNPRRSTRSIVYNIPA